MRRIGVVHSVHHDQAVVKFEQDLSACRNCSGCIAFRARQEEQTQALTVSNRFGASVGDVVVVELGARSLLKLMGITYGFPTAGLFLGYYSGWVLWRTEIGAALTAVLGLSIFALLVKPLLGLIPRLSKEPIIIARKDCLS